MSFKFIDFKADSNIERLKFKDDYFEDINNKRKIRNIQQLLKSIEIVGYKKENDLKFLKQQYEKENNISYSNDKNEIPKLKKLNKYSNLKLSIGWFNDKGNGNGNGIKLSKNSDRIFKFKVEDHLVFIDMIDKRTPDYSQIFLSRFMVYDLVNENDFSVIITFYGLPKSYGCGENNSNQILILPNSTKTNLKSSDDNHKLNNKQPTYLVRGSKIKRDSIVEPIPKPVFTENVDPDELPLFPLNLLKRESPCVFGKCKE